MKKLFAVLLAVTMIATLIPSAFADEGEGNTDSWTVDCELESRLNTTATPVFKPGTSLTTLTYDVTNNIFKYVDSSIANDTPLSSGTSVMYGGATDKRFFKLVSNAATKAFISFEVNIPREGEYSLKVHHQMASKGGMVHVYVTDANSYATKSFTSATASGFEKYGEYNTNGTGSTADFAGSNSVWDTTTAFTDKKLSAGKYVVTFYVPTNVNGCVGTFTLTGTPVEEEPAEPETKKAIIYNVPQIMKDNGIHYGAGKVATAMTYEMTNGLFEVIDARGSITIGGALSTTHNFLKLAANATVDFKVNVPEDGTYFLNVNHQLSKDGGTVYVYADGEYVGSYNCKSAEAGVPDKFASDDTSVWENDVLVTENGIELSAGEHVISYSARDGYGMISYFELANENLTVDSVSLVYVDKTTLEIDETATISDAVVSSLDGTVKAQSDTNTIYTSSNDSVATVVGTEITAVGTGTADITATVGGITAKRTITVIDKAATDEVETVQFMATSTIADNAGVRTEITGYIVGETTDEIAPGTTVKVIADPVSGYIFRGWKRGSKDNGVWLSTSETYSFPLLTNTYLTAVYDVDTATDAAVNVEFYNFNGQFLASKPVDETAFATLASDITPTLTGYNNYFWTINGTSAVPDDTVFNKLTRVVAKFTDKDSFNVTVPENVDSNKASGGYEYDTEIKMTATADGFWKVNGEVVAYGKSYTYIVWSEAVITFEAKENDGKPIISLDPKTIDGARMISYDANDAEIVEAGILFGENATINSANSRAVSRDAKGNVSGQFTAMPYNGDGTKARGYLIYNDNGTYRVIYAD